MNYHLKQILRLKFWKFEGESVLEVLIAKKKVILLVFTICRRGRNRRFLLPEKYVYSNRSSSSVTQKWETIIMN